MKRANKSLPILALVGFFAAIYGFALFFESQTFRIVLLVIYAILLLLAFLVWDLPRWFKRK